MKLSRMLIILVAVIVLIIAGKNAFAVDEIAETDYILEKGVFKNTTGTIQTKLKAHQQYKVNFDITNKPFVPFVKTIGGSKEDLYYRTILDNGSYVSVGQTMSNDGDFSGKGKGLIDSMITKYDNEGKILWNQTLGGSDYDYSTSVIKDINGGYVLLGYTHSKDKDLALAGTQFIDGMVAKYREDGTREWVRVIGGYEGDLLYGIKQTKDGGFICSGWTSSHLPYATPKERYERNAYLVKLDRYGQVEWQKNFGTKANEEMGDIIEVENNNFIIVGTRAKSVLENSKNGEMDGYIVKLNSKGNIIWEKEFGGSKDDLFRAMTVTNDGNYMVVGYSFSNDKDLTGIGSKGERDGLIVKYDKNGNILSKKTFGGSKLDYFLGIRTIKDGVLICGFSTSTDGDCTNLNNGAEDAIILKYNDAEELQWKRNFGGSKNERLRTITPVPDGGYIITGDSSSNDRELAGKNRGLSDALIVKFNEDGSLGLKRYDENVTEARYKIESSNGSTKKILKEGKFENITVLNGKSVTEGIDLLLTDEDVEEIIVTAELYDEKDVNPENNKLTFTIPVEPYKVADTDYKPLNGRATDLNGEKQNILLSDTDYKFKFDVNNQPGKPFIKTFGGTGTEHFEKHILTNDGGFLAVGRSNSLNIDVAGMNKGGTDGIIVKYDYKGDVEWKRNFGGSGTDFIYNAVQTLDGNYVTVGMSASSNGDMAGTGITEAEGVMVKYDVNGNILWRKVMASQGPSDRILHILEDSSGNLYTAEEHHIGINNPKTYADAVYRKYTQSGDLIWERVLSGTGQDNAYGLTLTKNGDVLGLGRFTAKNGAFASVIHRGNSDAYIVRLNGQTGGIKWLKTIGGSNNDDLRSAVENDDGTLRAIGRTESNDYDFSGKAKGSLDGFTAKLNGADGSLIPMTLKTWGGKGYDNNRYLAKTRDGGYLISGDSASNDGDLLGANIVATDAIWMKRDANFNIQWTKKINGSGDEATQSGMELPNGGYIVAGETTSTDGMFAGLSKGGQDGFIARLDENGELSIRQHDEYISSINYKIEAKSGSKTKLLKSGSFTNEYVKMDSSLVKELDFNIPKEFYADNIVVTVEVIDDRDYDPSNNTLITTVPVKIDKVQDFSIDEYNIKDSANNYTSTLEIGKKYKFNTKLLNSLVDKFSKKISIVSGSGYDEILDTATYRIYTSDGINESSKKLIKSATIKNTNIKMGEHLWSGIEFNVPEDKSINEIILEASIADSNDMIPDDNTLSVKLPIFYKIENDVGIKDDLNDETDGITVYPVGSSNKGSWTANSGVSLGEPITVKATVGSTNIKTQNLKAVLRVDGKEVDTKISYGISADAFGAVYFSYVLDKFNDTSADFQDLKIQVEIKPDPAIPEDFTKEVYKNISDPMYVHVVKPTTDKEEDQYKANPVSSSINMGESVGYIKIIKTDRTKLIEETCNVPCQENEAGKKICPKHKKYIYDDTKSYPAFIPIETYLIDGIIQEGKIKDIRYRSKYTKDMKGMSLPLNPINSSGFVSMLNSNGDIKSEAKNLIKLKSGYGFELQVDTQYRNNLPSIFENFAMANTSLKETEWSKYENYTGSDVNIVYADVDKEVNKYLGLVGLTVPAMDNIGVYYPNQYFAKTPSVVEEYLENGNGIKVKDENTTASITPDKKFYEHKKSYRLSSKSMVDTEKYYVKEGVTNGNYRMKLFIPRIGIGATRDDNIEKVKDIKEFDINIYGGYSDDLKTHLNE